MAQLLIRNLDDRVKEQLRERARRNKRSLEAEARETLTASLDPMEMQPGEGLGTYIVRLFKDCPVQPGEFPELREWGHEIPDFSNFPE